MPCVNVHVFVCVCANCRAARRLGAPAVLSVWEVQIASLLIQGPAGDTAAADRYTIRCHMSAAMGRPKASSELGIDRPGAICRCPISPHPIPPSDEHATRPSLRDYGSAALCVFKPFMYVLGLVGPAYTTLGGVLGEAAWVQGL
jgi:hypothetical protein